MIINEIFYSIQGEGLLAGVPSVFIRLAGCPLRCSFCDTKYALDPTAGDDMSFEQIIDKVNNLNHLLPSTRRPLRHVAQRKARFGKNKINSACSAVSAVKERCKFIVITGGEPMVNPQLPQLAEELKKLDKHITIETAGIKFTPQIPCDLMSISPKILSNTEPVKQLIEHYPYQLKFVVDTPADLAEIQKFITALRNADPSRIMLMPQARTRDELLAKAPMVADLCRQTGYAFCSRLQILLYNAQRGK